MKNCSTICRQIGWNNALVSVGVKLGKSQDNKKITEDSLLNEILRLWTELGRQPTTTDLKNRLSEYPRERFSARFGSWGNTLNCFIEWANSEGFIQPENLVNNNIRTRRTSRDVNLRLRFKVMQRDHFKCCTCGSAPSNDPTIKLHIDHVMPWAQGGETEIDNLQTLC